MKKIVEYKDGDGTCEVGDVVFLRSNLSEKAELLVVHKSEYCDVYIFKPLSDNSIFMQDENGNIPFYGIPYIYAKEVEVEEEQP
jgi:hypothetical protein